MSAIAPEIQDLLNRLAKLEQRCKEQEKSIPSILEKEHDWQGLAYVIDGVRVLSDMKELRELLPYPEEITQVPGTQDWMLGLANVRGELLPIADLQRFVGGNPIPRHSKKARVLVIRNRGMSMGLLVSSVIGMRHFPKDKLITNTYFPGALSPYIYDVFDIDSVKWPVFSMAALANDKRFLSAAA